MARPRKPIDPKKVERLASIGCPPSEIAAALNIEHKLIERRFGDVVKKGHETSRKRCRSWLFAKAAKGDTACIIFLAKAWCGMKEHPDVAINVSATATGGSIQFTPETKKELEDFYVAMQRRNYNRVRNGEPEKLNANGESPALN